MSGGRCTSQASSTASSLDIVQGMQIVRTCFLPSNRFLISRRSNRCCRTLWPGAFSAIHQMRPCIQGFDLKAGHCLPNKYIAKCELHHLHLNLTRASYLLCSLESSLGCGHSCCNCTLCWLLFVVNIAVCPQALQPHPMCSLLLPNMACCCCAGRHPSLRHRWYALQVFCFTFLQRLIYFAQKCKVY